MPNQTGIDAGGSLIGGPRELDRNLVSGNGFYGIDASACDVVNNYVGTDASGLNGLGNQQQGIYLGPINRVIGNVVADNGFSGTPATVNLGGDFRSDCGIYVRGDDNVIQGNIVGMNAGGQAPLGNAGSGVEIHGEFGNLVGGEFPADGNLIAHNGDDGVEVHARFANIFAEENRILGNSIFANTRLGIDLDNNGFTPNDAGDTDEFSNLHQNFPILTFATSSGVTTRLLGSLSSIDGLDYRVEFFANDEPDSLGAGEGRHFLGSTLLTTSGGTAAIDITLPGVAGGKYITATATDPAGNTSEFSPSVQATGPAALDYAAWKIATGLTGANSGAEQNFDQDSAANGVEFALGGDPLDPTDAPNLRPVAPDSSGASVFAIRKPPGLTGVTWEIETSPDMSVWSMPLPTVLEDGPGVLRVLAPPGIPGFARLRIIVDE